ncbi:MAG: iron ABC transporter permease [Bacteroidales bacterium]|nr:iron ABC transporter permease [Bacteroidales bacterium]
MKKHLIPIIIFSIIILFFANLIWGSVSIPIESVFSIITGKTPEKSSWGFIILESRLPQAITAMFAGGALAASGLLLQSVFNNPLAGPSILGIDSGASLGVAIVILLGGGSLAVIEGLPFSSGYLALVVSAFIGASIILGLIIFFASIVKSNTMVLIIGIMVGYLTSAIISILNFFSNEQGVHAYTMWGMGDFSSVSLSKLPIFCIMISIGLLLSILLIKPLNALLLGERYAENLGINVKRIRIILLVATGILTAITTAFCGPISFIGLAVPHISRLILKSSNQNILMPCTILCGSSIALLCNFLSNWPGYSGIIPLNAITPIIGAPIIIYVIVNQKRIQYFN